MLGRWIGVWEGGCKKGSNEEDLGDEEGFSW